MRCRELTGRAVPLSDPAVCVLITNSNVKHQLTGSEYPERRAACLDSAQLMAVPSLREVDAATVDSFKQRLEEVTYRRVRHVVSEIARYLRSYVTDISLVWHLGLIRTHSLNFRKIQNKPSSWFMNTKFQTLTRLLL